MKCAILASGPSMSHAVANSVRGYDIVVAVSNVAVETIGGDGSKWPALAPWADALAAQDQGWWRLHPKAHDFAGRKFSGLKINGVERVGHPALPTDSNSGVLALYVAHVLGARHIELYGFDMQGTHYFGKHREPMRNTKPERFEVFQKQFSIMGDVLKKDGVSVVNKTPGSALRCFPACLT